MRSLIMKGRSLRVFWLDAHTDFNTAWLTPSGNLHGMPVACLCGFGPPGLVDLGGAEPALRPDMLRLIGIRSVDAGEREFVHEQGLDVYDMRTIDEQVVPALRAFDPRYLVISAGFDTYKQDPIGAFTLENHDYHALGDRLGQLGLPTTVVQEGGYFTDALGPNVRSFLHGVRDGQAKPAR